MRDDGKNINPCISLLYNEKIPNQSFKRCAVVQLPPSSPVYA